MSAHNDIVLDQSTELALERITDGWSRLGAGFLGSGDGHGASPDLERLILDTAVYGRHDPRMVMVAITWLSRYTSLVAEHRLCKLIADGAIAREDTAALGFILDAALGNSRRHDRRRNLSRAMDLCTPASVPAPYFTIDMLNEKTRTRAMQRASERSLRWNLWVDPVDLKYDALRTRAWVTEQNPDLRFRAMFRGDLRATILLALEDDIACGASVTRLSKACGVTRPAVENALHDLELARAVQCIRIGRSCRVLRAA